MREIDFVKVTFLSFAAFFSKKMRLYKEKAGSAPEESPVIADLDCETGVLTVRFLKDLDDVYIEVINDFGSTIYYEPIEDVIAHSDVCILLTYEEVGEYHLSVLCNDKPLYMEEFAYF